MGNAAGGLFPPAEREKKVGVGWPFILQVPYVLSYRISARRVALVGNIVSGCAQYGKVWAVYRAKIIYPGRGVPSQLDPINDSSDLERIHDIRRL